MLRLMKYIVGTQELCLTLKSEKTSCLKCYAHTAFAVYQDCKQYTGATLTIGKGKIVSLSRKKKLNTKSSMESKLVGADDASNLIFWTKLFMEVQRQKDE